MGCLKGFLTLLAISLILPACLGADSAQRFNFEFANGWPSELEARPRDGRSLVKIWPPMLPSYGALDGSLEPRSLVFTTLPSDNRHLNGYLKTNKQEKTTQTPRNFEETKGSKAFQTPMVY